MGCRHTRPWHRHCHTPSGTLLSGPEPAVLCRPEKSIGKGATVDGQHRQEATKISVFVGTKAQYIKTAPLLRLMDQESVPYVLIDSGQHGDITQDLRDELGVRNPDVMLADGGDITSVSSGIRWALRLLRLLLAPKHLRGSVFQHSSVCVVHGDTVTTLVGALLARRAGVAVAHLEAGLRSWSLLNPFPEELVRIVVMRLSSVCFAPTPADVKNLRLMGLSSRTVALSANTSVEATQYSSGQGGVGGPAVFTMHRLENLKQKDRLQLWVDAIRAVAQTQPVRVVLHEPTRQALEKHGLLSLIEVPNVELSGLVAHHEFVALLASATFVVVDGGSIQEECAYLGVPALLWRSETEREHGLGSNVVLSRFDRGIIDRFITDPTPFRRPASFPDTTPSAEVLRHLLTHR
jgi:UDP-N-acetylglucosamine 2-epimerase (non-hydrolysing)